MRRRMRKGPPLQTSDMNDPQPRNPASLLSPISSLLSPRSSHLCVVFVHSSNMRHPCTRNANRLRDAPADATGAIAADAYLPWPFSPLLSPISHLLSPLTHVLSPLSSFLFPVLSLLSSRTCYLACVILNPPTPAGFVMRRRMRKGGPKDLSFSHLYYTGVKGGPKDDPKDLSFSRLYCITLVFFRLRDAPADAKGATAADATHCATHCIPCQLLI